MELSRCAYFKSKTLEIMLRKIYLSNIEHDVTTSKIPFLSLLPRECMSTYFLKTFLCMQCQYKYRQKCILKFFKFPAVTYDMGVLSCAFDVVKTTVCVFLCVGNN